MALQGSGLIRLSQIQGEFGGSNPISLSEYYRGGNYVTNGSTSTSSIPTSGAIRFSNFYGTSAADLTPDPVNWTGASSSNQYVAGGRGITNRQFITGISQSITLRITLDDLYHSDNEFGSGGGIDIDYAFGDIGRDQAGWAYLGSLWYPGQAFGDIIVNNGAGLKFRFTTGGDGIRSGNMNATIGVANVTIDPSGNTLLDSFFCSASWFGQNPGGPIRDHETVV